ncbi:WecB/TagA/CpsF family glycosyltransferase [Lactiplantibacillus plantarum]|uniref:WecB/TagA/CpsF family glycosyltransferase n=1 Tax=Lactiplantibacillus plantarum TaxID=1590 RepID=UPI0028FC31D0|nr:WecB/TagA/CpsF family glycosyltransferase [Lactiplantibacillus plantarum]WNW17347.1 WecB/TagA/CpsF family glycosyltransferase [Lactiplantibacillus plantarum]WNW20328.1 WecB/TagA/CpsF family glycosyltransferase [Lactiplantibacillus plantarum]
MNSITASQEEIIGDRNRIHIMGTQIDVLTVSQTVNLVEQYVQLKIPLHLIGVNADKLNANKNNPSLEKIVNSCGIINADGASVVLASKFLGKPLPERVAGIDLMYKLVELSADKGYSIYLLGARKTVVERTAKNLKSRFSGLNIVGIRDGYFDESEWGELAEQLRQKKPDFIFVGITSPLKEYLVEFLQNHGVSGVLMGVGGSFDVISGKIKRAPKWMQKANLEWLFRVGAEPKRLFKRYFIGNFRFIRSILHEKFLTPDN